MAEHQGYIRKIYHKVRAPLDYLEDWRKRRPGHKIERTQALRHWARVMQEKAKTAKGRAKWKLIQNRYRKKIEWLRNHKDDGQAPANLVYMDGRQVPGWIAEILQEARSSGAWNGSVISGFRSPSYSTSLCYAMCGAPSCSGMCAGAASNHACPPSGKGTPYEGAVDVTDPYNLERFCRNHNKPLYGGGYRLSRDHPHFSHSGV